MHVLQRKKNKYWNTLTARDLYCTPIMLLHHLLVSHAAYRGSLRVFKKIPPVSKDRFWSKTLKRATWENTKHLAETPAIYASLPFHRWCSRKTRLNQPKVLIALHTKAYPTPEASQLQELRQQKLRTPGKVLWCRSLQQLTGRPGTSQRQEEGGCRSRTTQLSPEVGLTVPLNSTRQRTALPLFLTSGTYVREFQALTIKQAIVIQGYYY